MPDIFTVEKRSDIMSRIKGKNTSVEKVVFGYLRKEKVYFQKHYKRAAGSPDIALPRKKRAVFIDGDFWHGKNYEARKERLSEFWRRKIERNMARDRQSDEALMEKGWQVLHVWEYDIKTKRERPATLARIKEFLIQ